MGSLVGYYLMAGLVALVCAALFVYAVSITISSVRRIGLRPASAGLLMLEGWLLVSLLGSAWKLVV